MNQKSSNEPVIYQFKIGIKRKQAMKHEIDKTDCEQIGGLPYQRISTCIEKSGQEKPCYTAE